MLTAEGSMEVAVPQTRDTFELFESSWLRAVGTRSRRLLELIPALYVKGIRRAGRADPIVTSRQRWSKRSASSRPAAASSAGRAIACGRTLPAGRSVI